MPLLHVRAWHDPVDIQQACAGVCIHSCRALHAVSAVLHTAGHVSSSPKASAAGCGTVG